MKARLSLVFLILVFVLVCGSAIQAQSGTYEPPPTQTPEEETYDIASVRQIEIFVEDTFILTANPEPPGTEVVWTSDNEKIATVQAFSPTARVTGISPGTTTITCTALTPHAGGGYWQEEVIVIVYKKPVTPGTAGSSLPWLITAAVLLLLAAVVSVKIENNPAAKS